MGVVCIPNGIIEPKGSGKRITRGVGGVFGALSVCASASGA